MHRESPGKKGGDGKKGGRFCAISVMESLFLAHRGWVVSQRVFFFFFCHPKNSGKKRENMEKAGLL